MASNKQAFWRRVDAKTPVRRPQSHIRTAVYRCQNAVKHMRRKWTPTLLAKSRKETAFLRHFDSVLGPLCREAISQQRSWASSCEQSRIPVQKSTHTAFYMHFVSVCSGEHKPPIFVHVSVPSAVYFLHPTKTNGGVDCHCGGRQAAPFRGAAASPPNPVLPFPGRCTGLPVPRQV